MRLRAGVSEILITQKFIYFFFGVGVALFIALVNGCDIAWQLLDNEDDAMGMTQTICWINEPYNFSHEVYRQLAQRSKFIIFDWNPKQNHWIEKEKLKKDTFVHYSTFRDNPFISLEGKRQILSYQSRIKPASLKPTFRT